MGTSASSATTPLRGRPVPALGLLPLSSRPLPLSGLLTPATSAPQSSFPQTPPAAAARPSFIFHCLGFPPFMPATSHTPAPAPCYKLSGAAKGRQQGFLKPEQRLCSQCTASRLLPCQPQTEGDKGGREMNEEVPAATLVTDEVARARNTAVGVMGSGQIPDS